jgi:hypothetical protein
MPILVDHIEVIVVIEECAVRLSAHVIQVGERMIAIQKVRQERRYLCPPF